MKSLVIAIAIVGGALAACSDGQTAIRIDVRYDDSWALTGLQLASGSSMSTTGATHTVTIIVPDAWDGQPQSIAVIGMRGADQWAQGTATVTPKRGDTVDAHASLALLTCATSCIEGAQACVAGGLATCEQHADSCFDLSAPVACGGGTRCAGDACVAGDPVVLPSNSVTFGALEQTGMTLDVANGYVFDTDADCYTGSALGDCTPVAPIGSPAVCVCHADTVTIHDLEVRGSRGLAILAWSSVVVQGNMVMDPGTGLGPAPPSGGNAGGSFATLGGNNGAATYGTAELVPLVGGMTGQGTSPGSGGGALQITADQMVRVEGTISVPGGGATSDPCTTTHQLVGDGGGAGGALVLEARHVDVVGGVAANGGGGAAGAVRFGDGSVACSASGSGNPGSTSATAPGNGGANRVVKCGSKVVAYSGIGGPGSLGDNPGGNSGGTKGGTDTGCSTTDVGVSGYGGGGGGGAGRIRINTQSDPCGCTGFMSPSPARGTVVVE